MGMRMRMTRSENWNDENDDENAAENGNDHVGIVLAENWDVCSFDEDFDLDLPPRVHRWDGGEEADDEDEEYRVQV